VNNKKHATEAQRITELETLLTQRDDEIENRSNDIKKQQELIALHEVKIRRLSDITRRLLRHRFGARTEKTHFEIDEEGQAYLALLSDALLKEKERVQADMRDDEHSTTDDDKHTDAYTSQARTRQKKKPRRRNLSETHPDAPVDDIRIELPESERFDSDGHPLIASGTEVHEELDIVHASARIRRITRVIYARSDTAEKIRTAALPERILPRGLLSDRSIIASVVHHAGDCLPFYRQSEMIGRMGIPVSRQVLTNSFHQWCTLAEPLLDAIQASLLQAPILHIDGTFIHRHSRKRKRKTCRKPVYAISDGQQLLMRWRDDEAHSSAADLIPGYNGYLVRDEWAGWYTMDTGSKMTHVGCNAHARRYFGETQDSDADARHMVNLFSKLYAIERIAAETCPPNKALHQHRYELRQQESVGFMDDIRDYAQKIADRCTGIIATKARYILKHQTELRRFLDDGSLPPDNNLAEGVLRRIALLRKNRLFYVAEDGGKNLATAMSLVGSCRLLGINPHSYLMDCLPILFQHRAATLHNTNIPDLSQWTPAAWAERQLKIAPEKNLRSKVA